MKKFVFILLALLFVLATKIYGASQVTRAEFAKLIFPIICDKGAVTEIEFSDVNSDADYMLAAELAVEYGILEADQGKFNPTGTITREEGAVALVKCFEIRCGSIISLGRDTFASDWFDIERHNREYISKAATIGAIDYNDSNMRIVPKTPLTIDAATLLAENVLTCANNMIDKLDMQVNASILSDFHDVNQTMGLQYVDVFIAYNNTDKLNSRKISIISALKNQDEIAETSIKSYDLEENSSFYVLHDKLDLRAEHTEMEIYVWDGHALIPLLKKQVLRH